MTFEKLERQLPNGFLDSEIRNVRIDFLSSSLELGVNVDTSIEGEGDAEQYRCGTLIVRSLYVFFIDPPSVSYAYISDASPINVTGGTVKPGQHRGVDALLADVPQGATWYRFFLDDWNSFMYLAGADVDFRWDEEQEDA